MKLEWYDYDKGQYVLADTPTTDEQAVHFLPKGPARNLYAVHRADGKSIRDAMRYVLEFINGIHLKGADNATS
jgi:hypothetical protein